MTFRFSWTAPELQHQVNQLSQAIGAPVDLWQAPEKPPCTTMTGRYCRLDPFNVEEHCEQLFNSYSLDTEARNWTYLPYGPFENQQAFSDWCTSSCLGEDPLFHTVIDNSNQLALGMASYLRISPEAGSIEVGHIHFSPAMQGKRQATEAMFLMMARVFEELGYRRYEWKCDALNTPSCNAAQRFGFQFEGIFRQATVYKQRNRDTAWFAVLDSDWPKLKAGYQSWLDEQNFDEAGQQIRSLKQCMR